MVGLRRIGQGLATAWRRVDPVLLICTLILTGISLLTVFGAVDNFGMSKLKMQLAMAVLGVVATVVIANLDYHTVVERTFILMFFLSVALLTVTLLFGSSGENRETANRSWLTIPGIGIAIQPS